LRTTMISLMTLALTDLPPMRSSEQAYAQVVNAFVLIGWEGMLRRSSRALR
jgi:hypothetical protein